MRRGNWSAPELMRLRELFPRLPPERVARLLDRTVASVLRRARRMFARERRDGPWSEADDAVLRQAIGVHDLDTLALLVARAPEDVATRLQEFRRAPRRGPWSDAEVALLRRVYGTRGADDLGLCLCRSVADVEAKARELCIGKDKAAAHDVPLSMPRWSAESVARLRELYASHDNLEIARILGRTVSSVANKASQLGLSKGRAALRRMGRANVGRRGPGSRT